MVCSILKFGPGHNFPSLGKDHQLLTETAHQIPKFPPDPKAQLPLITHLALVSECAYQCEVPSCLFRSRVLYQSVCYRGEGGRMILLKMLVLVIQALAHNPVIISNRVFTGEKLSSSSAHQTIKYTN